ncbi:non-contractile tail fiber/tailspike protein [Klebsiella phage KpV92]|nr:non-contractile tail fiber/tailspike protein [Klebsiella phage KpV92]
MLNNLNQPKGSTIGVLRDGRTVQETFDSLMYTEVLLKAGKENAEWNRASLQAAADSTKLLAVPAGEYYISAHVTLRTGNVIVGRGANAFSSGYTRLVCETPGEGIFWYTDDASTGQKRMPQVYNMGLKGDYPIRFNDERTAIIADQGASNVPYGMVPVVQFCTIDPLTNGVGIGISASKMFDGAFSFNEIANFDTGVLLNGCDLMFVAHNRIRNAHKYMVLELGVGTFGSQNEIYHNDILHAGSPNCIFIKSTARHVRIYDNYLEQASGTAGQALIGFIDASEVDSPSFNGNAPAVRASTIIKDNRIDGQYFAKYFVYKYQPSSQTYGVIEDVSTVGPNTGLGANHLVLVDASGNTVDRVPFLYNSVQPCSFRFSGPRFGKWNGYSSVSDFSLKLTGLNMSMWGTSLGGNSFKDYLYARGNSLILTSGFTAAAVLQFPVGTLVRPSSQYAIKVTAKCSSGSETLTFAGVANGVGQTSVSMQLSTEPTSATTQFTSGTTQSGFSLGRSNNGSDIEILAIEFIKLYSLEYSVVADTGATTVYRGSGDVVISASGNLQFPAYVVLRYIGGSLKEVYKSVTDAAVIDITWSVSGQTLTVNITGSGGGKRFSVTQEEV